MFSRPLYMEGEECPCECHYYKDVTKDHAKSINPAKDDFIAKKIKDPACAFRHIKKVYKSKGRNEEQIRLLCPSFQKWQKECPKNK